MNEQMATALIEIHNALPDSLDELIAKMPDNVESEFEWLEIQFSNLLVDLWEIVHRFPHKSLEDIIEPPNKKIVAELLPSGGNNGHKQTE